VRLTPQPQLLASPSANSGSHCQHCQQAACSQLSSPCLLMQANCARRMTYFQSLLLTLMVFKLVIVTVVVVSWAVPAAQKRWRDYRKWRAVPAAARSKNVRRRTPRGVAAPRRLKVTDWIKVWGWCMSCCCFLSLFCCCCCCSCHCCAAAVAGSKARALFCETLLVLLTA
jgi:hypothetical protein